MIRLAAISARKWATRGLASSAGHLPNTRSLFVSNLKFINSVTGGDELIPTYRVLDGVGKPLEGAEIPEVFCFCYKCLPLLIALTDRREACTEDVREHAAPTCSGQYIVQCSTSGKDLLLCERVFDMYSRVEYCLTKFPDDNSEHEIMFTNFRR